MNKLAFYGGYQVPIGGIIEDPNKKAAVLTRESSGTPSTPVTLPPNLVAAAPQVKPVAKPPFVPSLQDNENIAFLDKMRIYHLGKIEPWMNAEEKKRIMSGDMPADELSAKGRAAMDAAREALPPDQKADIFTNQRAGWKARGWTEKSTGGANPIPAVRPLYTYLNKKITGRTPGKNYEIRVGPTPVETAQFQAPAMKNPNYLAKQQADAQKAKSAINFNPASTPVETAQFQASAMKNPNYLATHKANPKLPSVLDK